MRSMSTRIGGDAGASGRASTSTRCSCSNWSTVMRRRFMCQPLRLQWSHLGVVIEEFRAFKSIGYGAGEVIPWALVPRSYVAEHSLGCL